MVGESPGITMVTFAVITVLLAAILYPVFMSAKTTAPNTTCLRNVKDVTTAMVLYASDTDGRLPDSRSWTDGIAGRVRSGSDAFGCPLVKARYAYAMHDSLSRAKLDAIEAPETQLMIFESRAMIPNAHGDESLLPRPPRHYGRNTVGFAAGYAKHVRLPQTSR